ncbi:MAG: hypothetical protein QNJ97_13975 [Myxococcota bacterium]|nr:hypothetical protein [Myxococcota bacterium]
MPNATRFKCHPWAIAPITVFFGVAVVHADDLTYVSKSELQSEIDRRSLDIERTQARIAELQQQKTEAVQSLNIATANADNANALAVARATLLYRLTRSGSSLRYLLGSPDAVQFLKRINQLKHLLSDSLMAERQAELRLAQAKERVWDLEREKQNAEEMLAMLQQALLDLKNEGGGT